jgi:cytoskeletal protein RodZ
MHCGSLVLLMLLRYVVLKGYCAVLKALQLESSSTTSTAAQTGAAAAANRRNSSGNGSTQHNSSSTSSSQHASRRSTMEQQVQQFALATAAVAGPASGDVQQQLAVGGSPATLAGHSVPGAAVSRRCTAECMLNVALPGGSRRVTGQQQQQQHLGGGHVKHSVAVIVSTMMVHTLNHTRC